MRLRFWRRKDSEPQWCDRGKFPWEHAPDSRSQETTIRTLRVPIGSTDLTIELFVGLADVSLRISRDVDECERVWESSQFPLDQSTLHGELRKSLVACGCDNVLAERLAERTLKELAALVVTARSERERRLSTLSAEACIEWGELTPIHRDGQVEEMWTQGKPMADGGSIMVRLTYRVGGFKIGGGHR